VAESALEPLIVRLERSAARLRAGDLPAEQAAELVEECARLAAEAANELDREVRAADVHVGAEDQLRLGGA
jgi:hypothetical protein